MKIVTYNLNGIRARLPRLLEYLEEQKPDVLCLQEVNAPTRPSRSRRSGRPAMTASGTARRASTASPSSRPAAPPTLRRDRPARRSRRHPQPLYRGRGGRRRRRLASICPTAIRSAPRSSPTSSPGWSGCAPMRIELLAEERPVVLAGDWNVIPTDDPDDVFSARAMAQRRADAAGKPRRLPPHPQPRLHRRDPRPLSRRRRSTPSGTIPPAAGSATPASASTICCSRRRPPTGCSMPASTRNIAAARKPATTRRPGSVSKAEALGRGSLHDLIAGRAGRAGRPARRRHGGGDRRAISATPRARSCSTARACGSASSTG